MIFLAALISLLVRVQGAALFTNVSLNNRIDGGFPIDIADAPYQVSLLTTEHFCGGTLISPRVVVTAAHCTFDKAVADVSVRIGSSSKSEGGTVIPAQSIREHPHFNEITMNNDFAILILSTPQEYTTEFAMIPDAWEEVTENEFALASGWGATNANEGGSELLQAVHVPIVDTEQCKQVLQKCVSDRMICAGDVVNGGIDSCQGDSGGPLVLNGYLIGIVSWGMGCARPYLPGVYTRVSAVSTWILKNMRC